MPRQRLRSFRVRFDTCKIADKTVAQGVEVKKLAVGVLVRDASRFQITLEHLGYAHFSNWKERLIITQAGTCRQMLLYPGLFTRKFF